MPRFCEAFFMRKFLLILLFNSLFYCNAQDFKTIIQYLASDSLHGRAPGTIGELLASKFIANQLSKKYNILFHSFSFIEDSISKKNAVNLICSSKKNKKKDNTVILMAHYDGLGINSSKSLEILSSKKKLIHNGADDNASGVAMVIELGKHLSKQRKKKYNYILLFTSAHEPGLFGSESFVHQYNIDSLKIKAVINFDMVGRLDHSSKMIRINNNQDDKSINDYLIQHKSNTLNLLLDDTTIHNTDLRYFENYKMPLLNFSTGTHHDYHKHTDDTHKINYEGMKLIYQFITSFLKFLNR
jgi:aminopeptidase-like protein